MTIHGVLLLGRQPLIHIVLSWSQVKEGDEIDITKSKDCSEVELSRFKVLTIDQNHTKKNKRRLSGVRFARILMPRVEFDENYTEIGD